MANASPDKMDSFIKSIEGTLVDSIESISSVNTNLKVLAINAKIQAARSGSAGAGFSVVADEMDRLATDTQATIGELRSNIGDVMQNLVHLQAQTRAARLQQTAASCMDIVDRNLYERSCDIRWWATGVAVVDALTDTTSADKAAHASDRLRVILDNYTVYEDLILCDLEGKIIASGRPDKFKYTGLDIKRCEWFRQAMSTSSGTEFGFDGPLWGGKLFNGKPCLVYSCSVRQRGNPKGTLMGVLSIVFDWEGLGKDVLAQAISFLSLETENQLQAFLCKPDGTIVSSNEDDWLGKPVPIVDFADVVSKNIKQQKDSMGNSILIGTAHSRGFKTYKTGWLSVIVESEKR
jgi:hypothetical protein